MVRVLYSCAFVYYENASNLIGWHGRSQLLTLVLISMDLLTLQPVARLINSIKTSTLVNNLYLLIPFQNRNVFFLHDMRIFLHVAMLLFCYNMCPFLH